METAFTLLEQAFKLEHGGIKSNKTVLHAFIREFIKKDQMQRRFGNDIKNDG